MLKTLPNLIGDRDPVGIRVAKGNWLKKNNKYLVIKSYDSRTNTYTAAYYDRSTGEPMPGKKDGKFHAYTEVWTEIEDAQIASKPEVVDLPEEVNRTVYMFMTSHKGDYIYNVAYDSEHKARRRAIKECQGNPYTIFAMQIIGTKYQAPLAIDEETVLEVVQ